MLHRPTPKRIAFAAAYVLAVLALFEAGARWLLRPETFCKRFQCQDDSTWRLRWVARHDGQPLLFYGFDAYHPQRGWALAPGLRNARDRDGTVVSSNSEGFRGTREFAREKPPGTTRILLLGDSYAFGAEVADKDTFAAALGELLPGAEILNLGVHGYGHDQMLLYLREVGVGYRPDVVILGFVGDDMLRNLLEFRDFAKPRFTVEHGLLVPHGIPVPPPEQVLRDEWWRPKLLDLLWILRQQARWKSGENRRAAQGITTAILDVIAETSRSAGAKPVLVYFPTAREVDHLRGAKHPDEMFFDAYCRNRDTPCLTLRPAFAAARRRGARLTRGAHWSPEGHRVAGEALARFLRERKLVGAGS